MSEEVNINKEETGNTEVVAEETQATKAETTPSVDLEDPAVKKLVESTVAEQLASIKDKLNDAYAARDEAVKAKVSLEEEKKAAVIKQMEEEGKHKEVYELRLAEYEAKLESLKRENVELTRNQSVRDAITDVEFRNDTARNMAYDTIVSQLVQDEHGVWKHRSGISISEFAKGFFKDDDNAFLLKPKTNNGAGLGTPQGTPETNKQVTMADIHKMSPMEQLEYFKSQNPEGNGPFGF